MLLSHKQIANVLGGYCGCLRTEEEVEELQHWCGNATGHGPEEESRPRKGKSDSRYSKHSKWELESKEREFVDIKEASSLVYPVASTLNGGLQLCQPH